MNLKKTTKRVVRTTSRVLKWFNVNGKIVACAIVKRLDAEGRDIALLLVRLSIFMIFFRSGMTKLEDWETTIFLFELEYAVPFLPPSYAAYLAVAFELVMPTLLIIGLATRLACLPLLSMALVIQFVLGANDSAYNQLSHYWWMMLLIVLITHGAGRLSLDNILCSHYCGKGRGKRKVKAKAPVKVKAKAKVKAKVKAKAKAKARARR